MPEPTPELSKITPVLVAALVCDAALVDPSSGKKTLQGIFDRMLARQLPARRAMTLYLKLTDAEGRYKIGVKLVQLNSGKLIAGADALAGFGSRLASSDYFISFAPLEFPEKGRYEFQVEANDVYLGGAFLDLDLLQPVST